MRGGARGRRFSVEYATQIHCRQSVCCNNCYGMDGWWWKVMPWPSLWTSVYKFLINILLRRFSLFSSVLVPVGCYLSIHMGEFMSLLDCYCFDQVQLFFCCLQLCIISHETSECRMEYRNRRKARKVVSCAGYSSCFIATLVNI